MLVVFAQNGRRGRAKIGAEEMDTLLRKRNFDHLPRRALRVRPNSLRIR